MLYKKSVVLSSVNSENKKAVLTMEIQNSNIVGNVRLYNFEAEPDGILSLGIYKNGKVTKAGLLRKDYMQYSFNCDLKEIPSNFSCAIVHFNGGNAKPLLFGASDGKANYDNVFGAVISSLYEEPSFENTKKALDENNLNYDEEETQEIENIIDKTLQDEEENNDLCNDCDKCQNCEYKKLFFESKLNETMTVEKRFNKLEEEKKEEEKIPTQTFYEKLKWQIDKLFAGNNKEEFLEQLLPNSKWVKVEYENDGDYYVFGLIYEDNEIRYICYGVPGVFQKNPPKELTGYPIWFPLSENNVEGFGYWLTYQDAETGEPIRAVVE